MMYSFYLFSLITLSISVIGLANIMAADASSLLQLYKMNSAHNSTMFQLFNNVFQRVLPKIYKHLQKNGVSLYCLIEESYSCVI